MGQRILAGDLAPWTAVSLQLVCASWGFGCIDFSGVILDLYHLGKSPLTSLEQSLLTPDLLTPLHSVHDCI